MFFEILPGEENTEFVRVKFGPWVVERATEEEAKQVLVRHMLQNDPEVDIPQEDVDTKLEEMENDSTDRNVLKVVAQEVSWLKSTIPTVDDPITRRLAQQNLAMFMLLRLLGKKVIK